MLLKMYEVNFGEAILFKDNAEDFMIDCGAKFGGRGKEAACKICPDLVNQKKTLLITHFDEDHYNGVLELNKCGRVKFDHIYLPLYIKKPNKNLISTWDFFKDTIRVLAYLKILGRPKKLDTLQNLFISLPQLVNCISDISCIGRGDHFYCVGKEFSVLWPEKKEPTHFKIYATELKNIVNEFNNSTDRITDFSEELSNIVENYVNAFINIYVVYAENGQEQEIVHREGFFQLMEELERTFMRLGEISIKINNENIKKRVASIQSTKIRNMNECSIVFHNEEVLMLGDISKRIYKQVISKDTYKQYKVIKIAHHGTKAYYCNNVANSKRYIVSNSGNDKTNWKICDNYEKNYPQKMICTNTRVVKCASITNTCSNCKIGMPDGTIVLDTRIL